MKPAPTIPQTDAARDKELIERLHDLSKHFIGVHRDTAEAAIARLRTLTTQPPSLPSNAEDKWNTGIPPVEEGGEKSFLVAFKSKHASGTKVFVKQLDYRNRYVGPESDHCSAECKEEPAGDDGEYYWTGWFESSCESCDTYWRFSNEVIGWIELPPAPAVLTPEEKIKAEDEKAWDNWIKTPSSTAANVDEAIKESFLAGRLSLREGGV